MQELSSWWIPDITVQPCRGWHMYVSCMSDMHESCMNLIHESDMHHANTCQCWPIRKLWFITMGHLYELLLWVVYVTAMMSQGHESYTSHDSFNFDVEGSVYDDYFSWEFLNYPCQTIYIFFLTWLKIILCAYRSAKKKNEIQHLTQVV